MADNLHYPVTEASLTRADEEKTKAKKGMVFLYM